MVQKTWGTNKIRIYTVQYVSSLNNCDITKGVAKDLNDLAVAAHGKYYCADTKENVTASLRDAYQNLSQIAGVDTTMALDFQNVAYVYNNTTYSGNDTVSYIANGPFVNHTKGSIDSGGRTSIIWTDGNQSVVNQTDDWNDDFNLNFTIGTIHIKETWETTFRLRMNKEGVINLFGPGSKISYNGGYREPDSSRNIHHIC